MRNSLNLGLQTKSRPHNKVFPNAGLNGLRLNVFVIFNLRYNEWESRKSLAREPKNPKDGYQIIYSGFTFWNWPPFNDKFIDDFKQKLNCDIDLVHAWF